jgi:hypothetical protein
MEGFSVWIGGYCSYCARGEGNILQSRFSDRMSMRHWITSELTTIQPELGKTLCCSLSERFGLFATAQPQISATGNSACAHQCCVAEEVLGDRTPNLAAERKQRYSYAAQRIEF